LEAGTLRNQKQKCRKKTKKVGLSFIFFSWIMYGFILVIPLLHIYSRIKFFICAALYVSSHAFFWVGVLILGREVVDKYGGYKLLSMIKRRKG